MKRIIILAAAALSLLGVTALTAGSTGQPVAAEPACSLIRVKVAVGAAAPLLNLCLLNDITG